MADDIIDEKVFDRNIKDQEIRISREEIDKEVEEEYSKYLAEEEKKHPTKKKSKIDTYTILSIAIMAMGVISTIIVLIQAFAS